MDTSLEAAAMIGLTSLSQTEQELIKEQNRRAIKDQITLLNEGVDQDYLSDGNGGLAYGIVTDAGREYLHAWDGER